MRNKTTMEGFLHIWTNHIELFAIGKAQVNDIGNFWGIELENIKIL